MGLQVWLERAGAEIVGPAPNLALALALIEGGRISAAVLDINLRDDEIVFPAADRLAERGIPFVFVTGNTQLLNSSSHHERPRLEKPCLEKDLVKILVELTGCDGSVRP